jgi:hypothetical protein
MPERDIQKDWNRDDELKPGRPPRAAYEPKGSRGSSRNKKTISDPSTGEPQDGAPEPNRSAEGETEGR